MLLSTCLFIYSCKNSAGVNEENSNDTFKIFEDNFLDSYWKQYPVASIFIGYGKYYDKLVIPGASTVSNNIAYSEAWLDSLKILKFDQLSENNKISFNIIKNQLESDRWYMGEQFRVKDFHETFLSFGSSPVKYIRDRMIKQIV